MTTENPDQGRSFIFDAQPAVQIRPYEGLDGTTLIKIKGELMEQSEQTGTIAVVGTFAEVDPDGSWLGKTSVKNRIAAGEITQAEVDEAIGDINKYFVAVTPGAQERCIDGRPAKGYNSSDPDSYAEKLGPQGPAGSFGEAICDRLADTNDETLEAADVLGDFVKVTQVDQPFDYLPGDHIDENHQPGRTGCGAIDGCEEHLAFFNPQNIRSIRHMTKAALGDHYNQEAFNTVTANSVQLTAVKDSYFAEKDSIIEKIVEANEHGAPVLTGSHEEVALCLNLVPQTTFHRDEFSAKHGNNLQVFNYDVWRTFERAEKRYPNDKQQQQRYIHARVALAISTAKHLMDDSIMLVVRTPQEAVVTT